MERLPYWFQLACHDPECIRLLEWEALQWVEHNVIDEERRQERFTRTLERFGDLQGRGLLSNELDPGQLFLSMLALTAFPPAFPQLTRMATGLAVSDPKFQKQREQFLRQFTAAFQVKSAAPSFSHNQKGNSK